MLGPALLLLYWSVLSVTGFLDPRVLPAPWTAISAGIELTREGRMDEMTVLAEARPEHWDGSGLAEHTERVAAYIKNTIGVSARVRAVPPETLERSLGKAKRVFDKRPKE